MADGEVKIDTKLDTDGLNEGLKDLKVKLNNLGTETDKSTKKTKAFNTALDSNEKKANKAADAIDKQSKKNKNLGEIIDSTKKRINTTTVAGIAAAAAITKTVEALNDCAAAYRVQANAEEALAVAAKNNPYLNDEAVYNLKNFAGELQKMSEYGDELSLQVMAQLAATGRTEEQIIQIMSAAADMAAVTGQDLGSAAQQLNATLNGNAGALGRQIDSINNLTEAELKNGKAIEIVAAQYKGSAAATADVEVQLSNAWGDFKENIGRGWQNVTQPVKQFFLDVLSDINEATAKTNAIKDAKKNKKNGTDSAADNKILIDEVESRVKQLKTQINETIELLQDEEKLNKKAQELRLNKSVIKNSLSPLQKTYEEEVKKLEELRAAYNRLTAEEKKAADAKAAIATEEKKAADARKAEEERANFIRNNTEALNNQLDVLRIKTDLTKEDNQTIEESIDHQELYNIYLQSYIDLLTKSNGLIAESDSEAKERLALLTAEAEKLKEITDEKERQAQAENLLKKADELTQDNSKQKSAYEKYAEEQQALQTLKDQLNENEILSEQEKADAMLAIDKAYAQNKKNLWQNITAEINDYTQQTADIAQKFGDLMLKNVQTETDLELAKLDEKYEKGEMGEEEYYEKQKAIKRKAAQEEYKIQMFQWTASILATTANIAEGVSKAIAQGGTAGLITGALVGAAGAVQIASIIASKPVPPQFYAGGIIGGANGATYGSDNTYIHARIGEMVLNAHQQRSLWDMINGQDSRQQAGFNLTVNNTQANRVDADVRKQDGEVFIDIFDKHINKGFTDGTYDAGLAAMNTRQEGVRIL